MPRTQVSTTEIGNSQVRREDLDLTTPSQAVIAKVIAGDYISLTETGPDSGTGDVTINVDPVTGSIFYRKKYTFHENLSTSAYMHVGAAENAAYTVLQDGIIKGISWWQSSTASKSYEVRVNNSTIHTEPVSVVSGFNNGLNTAISAGDTLRVFCQGSNSENNVVIVEIEYEFNVDALQGLPGPAGADGYSGFDFLIGNGAPSGAIGQDGDVYLDSVSGDFFKKNFGTWDPEANLKGPAGALDYCMLDNNTMTNINSSTGGVQLSNFNTSALFNSSPALFTVTSDGVIVNESGTYEVYISLYQTASVSRSNVGVEISVDGFPTGRTGASGYIRNSGGHQESSSSILDVVDVFAGEKIGVIAYRLANAGTVTAPAGTSVFYIKRIS